MKQYYCVKTEVETNGKANSQISEIKEVGYRPMDEFYIQGDKEVYTNWFDNKKAATKFMEER